MINIPAPGTFQNQPYTAGGGSFNEGATARYTPAPGGAPAGMPNTQFPLNPAAGSPAPVVAPAPGAGGDGVLGARAPQSQMAPPAGAPMQPDLQGRFNQFAQMHPGFTPGPFAQAAMQRFGLQMPPQMVQGPPPQGFVHPGGLQQLANPAGPNPMSSFNYMRPPVAQVPPTANAGFAAPQPGQNRTYFPVNNGNVY